METLGEFRRVGLVVEIIEIGSETGPEEMEGVASLWKRSKYCWRMCCEVRAFELVVEGLVETVDHLEGDLSMLSLYIIRKGTSQTYLSENKIRAQI